MGMFWSIPTIMIFLCCCNVKVARTMILVGHHPLCRASPRRPLFSSASPLYSHLSISSTADMISRDDDDQSIHNGQDEGNRIEGLLPMASNEQQPQQQQESFSSFNALGPPSYLASLKVGESIKIPLINDKQNTIEFQSITRLSQNPDIFLAPRLMRTPSVLIHAAVAQGLKPAGTRQSQHGTIRKHSFVTWLEQQNNDDDDDDDSDDDDDEQDESSSYELTKSTASLCRALFVHETLQQLQQKEDDDNNDYVVAEDMQIAKYETGGSFDLHHDGFNRFLTVLTYLNGVGGTFFPLAQTTNTATTTTSSCSSDESSSSADLPRIQLQKDGALTANDFKIGVHGLCIVGDEGIGAYADVEDIDRDHNKVASSSASASSCSSSVVRIQAGDSVIFYNYNLLVGGDDYGRGGGGQEDTKEWRSLHAGLPIQEGEKWIATNWFRSDALTGPFAYLHKERLVSSTLMKEASRVLVKTP